MAPVAGSKIAACTNADCAVFDSLHPPKAGFVAVSWYGVASPAAVSAFLGTISVQSGFGVAGGAGGLFPAAAIAAFCICTLRRSVLPGSGLVCADAVGERTDIMQVNTAVRPVAVCKLDWCIVAALLVGRGTYVICTQIAMCANSDMDGIHAGHAHG